jgi:heme exporter protein B
MGGWVSMKGLSRILFLLRKDLMVEFRRRFEILASIAFIAAASVIIAEAAFRALDPELVQPALWIIIIFISIFTSTVSFTREVDKNTIYGLRLLPVSPMHIFVSKIIFTLFLILFQGFISLYLLTVFSGQWFLLSFRTLIGFILLSIQLSIVASFTSAIVMYSEGRAFLIPMFIMIFTVPIIPSIISISSPGLPITLMDYLILFAEITITFATTTILSEFLLTI